MRPSFAELLARLRAEGLATDADTVAVRSALAQAEDDDIPWYMRVLVGIGAWAATAFLLGFVAMLDLFDSDGSRLVAGVLLIGGAVMLRRKTESEFVRQATLAMSLAGQGLVIFSIGELFATEIAALAAVALAAAMVVLMPDRVSRFLSAIIGSVAAIVGVVQLEIPYGSEVVAVLLVALSAFVWRVGVRERTEEPAEMLEPVGYGLLIAIFGVLTFGGVMAIGTLFNEFRVGPRLLSFGAITTLGITAALVALILAVLDEHDTPRQSGLTFSSVVAAVALGLGTLSSPGIVAGIAVLLLAFDRRNAVLLGLSILYLLVFGSMYYYSLNLTLLEKSGVLVGSGLLFFALYWQLTQRPPRAAGAQ